MKSTRTLIAGLALATFALPAFASDQGLPPDLEREQQKVRDDVAVDRATIYPFAAVFTPLYLVGMGEESVVPNPAVKSSAAPRPATAKLLSESAPQIRYVGA